MLRRSEDKLDEKLEGDIVLEKFCEQLYWRSAGGHDISEEQGIIFFEKVQGAIVLDKDTDHYTWEVQRNTIFEKCFV